MNNISILAEIFISASIIFRKCPKRVVLKIIFISVCHQENEVFHKSFASLFQKRVEFELQNVQWTFVLQRPKRSVDQSLKVLRFFCFKRVFEGVADKVRWRNFSQVKKVPLFLKYLFAHSFYFS